MKNKLTLIVSVTVLICAGLLMLTEAGASTATAPEEEWNVTFGGTDSDGASSVQQTSDGGYILAGRTGSYGAGKFDFWLVKTDSNGKKVWDKTFGENSDDGAWFVRQTSDGGYILVGGMESYGDSGDDDGWLIKLEGTGEVPATEKTSKKPIAPDIEKPPEKSIPGFGTLEAMVSICILAFLGRKRS